MHVEPMGEFTGVVVLTGKRSAPSLQCVQRDDSHAIKLLFLTVEPSSWVCGLLVDGGAGEFMHARAVSHTVISCAHPGSGCAACSCLSCSRLSCN